MKDRIDKQNEQASVEEIKQMDNMNQLEKHLKIP